VPSAATSDPPDVESYSVDASDASSQIAGLRFAGVQTGVKL
jgi:hypothetical protein